VAFEQEVEYRCGFGGSSSRVRDAILAGANDAAELLTQDGEDNPAPVVLRLAVESCPALTVANGAEPVPTKTTGRKRPKP
jgi:hypothetical protein